MKNFRKKRPVNAISFILIFICVMSAGSCNQLSQGLQRRKFEFLYKINTSATIFREYTSEVTYFRDLDFYIQRMKKFSEDINKIKAVEGYDYSATLLARFYDSVNENISSAEAVLKKSLAQDENIKKEYDIIVMNERADNFLKQVNDEIAKVGKE